MVYVFTTILFSVSSPAPPPYLYPPNTVFSSSTPDLAAGQSGGVTQRPAGVGGVGGVSGSSPDLVSRRTLGAAAIRTTQTKLNNSDLHRTFDNLAASYSTEVCAPLKDVVLSHQYYYFTLWSMASILLLFIFIF